ncbi:MAG TPA: MarR family winged helix-turn-helix transcriptional regulator [Rhodanobacteraceae bacterium]|nr:MarR family winged helix-turn-helix transcriptional regulator [Rhodanobacteraceae bacterium]
MDANLFQTTRCLCLAARRASRKITREFDQALREHGLRATQFTLLSALTLAGPTTIGALADLLAADRTTITRNLALVEKRDLVAIHADPADARSRIASITPQGHALLLETLPVWRKVQTELTEAMGESTADGLRRLAGGPCVMPLPDTSPAAST